MYYQNKNDSQQQSSNQIQTSSIRNLDQSKIDSFCSFCKGMALLLILSFIILGIVMIVQAKEEVSVLHEGTYRDWYTTEEQWKAAKIGAGIGTMIGGLLGGIFFWKGSEILCGYFHDIKEMRYLLKKQTRSIEESENYNQ